MTEIVAAFIIACSNLYHGPSNYSMEESQCVQRVAKCGGVALKDTPWADERVKRVLACSVEVHL